jgi:hypothetical protein
MSLILTLASRNLFQDRLRFIATLVGIVFSVVLVMVQLGLYLGFGRMVTAMIDHACAQFILRTVDWRVKSGSTATLISCAASRSARRRVISRCGRRAAMTASRWQR